MKLIEERKFTPIELVKGDTLEVTFRYKGNIIAQTEFATTARVVNCMRVYEARSFQGMKKAVIMVLGEVW